MQHGGDPMDVGAVQGQWDEYYYDQEGGGEGDGEVDAVGYYGYKGKGKGKGKSKGKGKGGSACYNCGSTAHFARDCPYPQKGKGEKGKGKGFQGMCYACGEVGHPARECPKGKGKGKGKSKGKGIWEVDSSGEDWNWKEEGKEEAGEIGAVDWKMVKGKRKLCEAFEKNKCEEKECANGILFPSTIPKIFLPRQNPAIGNLPLNDARS